MKEREAARLFSALSDPARLEIIGVLAKKEGCVSAIQLATGRNQPNVSQHLRVLREMGLVDSRRDGKRICYSLSDESVREVLAAASRWRGKHGK